MRNAAGNRDTLVGRIVRWQIIVTVVVAFAASVAAQASAAQKSAADNSASATPSKSATQEADHKGEGKGDGNLDTASLIPKIVEDWTTPSLKGSDLVAGEPLVGEVDASDPAYTLEITRVRWRPVDPIDLYIIKPAGITKPPVILYLYSYPFDNDRYLKPDFRKFLVKNGFAAVGFVSALTGQRYHSPRPMKEWFVSQLQESLATSAHDVQMILNYLASRGDLDMSRVGMYGEGSGASIAILAAAVDSRIKTLDLLNPWGDWPDWMAKSTLIPENERKGFLKPDFLAGIAPLDPLKWLPQLKTQTIRLQEVQSVTVTPVEAKQKIEAVAPAGVQLVRYNNTKAFVSAISSGTAFDWIKEQMRSGKSQDYRAAGQTQAKGSPDSGK